MKKTFAIFSILIIIIFICNIKYYRSESPALSIEYFTSLDQADDYTISPSNEAFENSLFKWKTNNSDTEINEVIFPLSQYGSQITYQAALNKLPDVFVFSQCNTKAWTDMNLLLDVSDAVEDYDQNDLKPLTREGKIYGFPVYNISASIICYDETVWKDLGYQTFSATWSELHEAEQRLYGSSDALNDANSVDEDAYNCLIAFGSGEDSAEASARDILFTLCGRNMDSKWFAGLVAADKESSFIDSDFIDTVDETGDILTSGIFNEDLNEIDDDTARERFISGDAPAFLGSIADAEYIMEKLKGTDRYNNLRFAPLPAVSGEPKTISAGFDYALGINAGVDPEKADLLKDLCRTLTGQTYADIAWSEMPVYGTTKPSDISLSSFDEVQKSLYHAVYDCEHTPLYSSYLDSSVNDSSSMSDVIDGKMQLQEYEEETSAKRTESTLNPPHVTTARDYAYRLQDTYEANYFTMADY